MKKHGFAYASIRSLGVSHHTPVAILLLWSMGHTLGLSTSFTNNRRTEREDDRSRTYFVNAPTLGFCTTSANHYGISRWQELEIIVWWVWCEKRALVKAIGSELE
ncbi:hypothetical protein F5141DRAFT_1109372 [Pisolithus sp. B1]|nr:hypothetical protein F5141DRAFT_1109372 [Pisolithus sp. B1]